MKRAFTLVEILIVLAIAAIITAILVPVFAASKTKAKETVSASNMKQIHMAIEMYRQDSDGSAFGSMEAMGLPSKLADLPGVLNLTPPLAPKSFIYYYYPVSSKIDQRHPSWAEYSQEKGDQTVLLTDLWFTPGILARGPRYFDDFDQVRYQIGITLGGNIRRKTASGNLGLDWWDR